MDGRPPPSKGSLSHFETLERFPHRVLEVRPRVNIIVPCPAYRPVEDEVGGSTPKRIGPLGRHDFVALRGNDRDRDVEFLEDRSGFDLVFEKWPDWNPRKHRLRNRLQGIEGRDENQPVDTAG